MGKIIALVVVAVIGGYFLFHKSGAAPAGESMKPFKESMQSASEPTSPLKEFTMTAYYDAKGVWFSLKEITVKKGDHVRVKVTNTAGVHNFTLDEFNIAKNLPLNQEMTIDFTADKAGTFQYYCSIPGHRAAGQVGTFTVTE